MRAPTTLLLLSLSACGASPGTNAPAIPPSHALIFDGDGPEGTSPMLSVDPVTLALSPLAPGLQGRRAIPSPDGRRIVLQSLGDATEPPYLELLEPGAAEPVRFTGSTLSYEREATWSPDGARLAFHADRDEPTGDIFVAEVVGTALVGITNLTAAGGVMVADVTPAWSPDGRWIAFTSYRGDDVAIWKMRPDGSEATQLTSGPGDDYFPTWSPDGSRLAFQRNVPVGQELDMRIGIIPADGGEPRFLPWPGKAASPAWHPEAELIAAITERDGERDVRVFGLDGTEVLHVPRPGMDRHPAWRRVRP